jgi:hypothetical protein
VQFPVKYFETPMMMMMMISPRVTCTNRNSSSQKGGHDEIDENGVWRMDRQTRGSQCEQWSVQ